MAFQLAGGAGGGIALPHAEGILQPGYGTHQRIGLGEGKAQGLGQGAGQIQHTAAGGRFRQAVGRDGVADAPRQLRPAQGHVAGVQGNGHETDLQRLAHESPAPFPSVPPIRSGRA